eukprot:NODE_772_length_1794_cov_26.345559_g630_i0.p3 GENE.NODE_772_length_1794_cov_26.345559_g630_i0~~NODE_772_length_1794_cov_26.345559_g630_i0.p3  ORF type:complete len:287 (-),score=86.14 NODE_772_length_1794_cov_26.345559_g630_i0:105-965(-)
MCNPHIVAATPGRLIDFMDSGFLSLANVSYLVLDEADRMLDMGFERDIMRIEENLNKEQMPQVMMFSATWALEVQRVASRLLKDPVKVVVGDTQPTVNHNVAHQFHLLENPDMQSRVRQLWTTLDTLRKGDHFKALVFFEMKRDVRDVHYSLKIPGVEVVCIHGDMEQPARERALGQFSGADSSVMLATDVASRGLDIKGVTHVINATMPSTVEAWIHRCGRTARYGKKGAAVNFMTNDDSQTVLKGVVQILKKNAHPIDPVLREAVVGTTDAPSSKKGKYGAPRW